MAGKSLFLVLLFVFVAGLMGKLVVFREVDAVRGRVLRVLAGSVSRGAVIAENRQASMVSEGDEGTAAAGLALVIIVTKCAIAAVKFTPDLA